MGAIVAWHVYDPAPKALVVQEPGADNRPEGLERVVGEVRIGEFFMEYGKSESALNGSWAKFRGKDFSNIVAEKIEVTAADYPVEWSFTTGEGHAAAAIHRGRVYVLDYDEALSSDMLRCFALDGGKELWRRWYRVPMKRNHGFSRTIPAVGDDYVATLGPEGHIMVCDPVSGDLLWTRDLKKEYATEVPFWYAGQCPLVEDGRLIVAPAGDSVLMAAYDIRTGEVKWECENSVGYKMSHSSVAPMVVDGRRTLVYMGVGGVCGVSPEGRLLWSCDKWQPSVIAPSALRLNNNEILLVAGYGAGGARLRVDGGRATIVEQWKPSEGLASEQQTPIHLGSLVLSVLPKDGGANRSKLVAYNVEDLRNTIWSSGADERFGLGPYMVIGDKLFVLQDEGELYVYQIGNKGFKLLKKQSVIENGADAWGPLAYADGRLILRDAHQIICLKIN